MMCLDEEEMELKSRRILKCIRNIINGLPHNYHHGNNIEGV